MKAPLRALGIIPARAGSKGLPGKNVLPTAGLPLIVWSVRAARESSLARTVVSTDGEEIAQVAREHGAEVPFLRAPELARDDTPVLSVVLDVLARIEAAGGGREGSEFDPVVLLQPTSPLRTAAHIDAALALLAETGADSVVSVCRAKVGPHWMRTVDDVGRLRPLLGSDLSDARRQDLPPIYALNGAVYATRRHVLAGGRLLGDDIRALIMQPEESVDVDTAWDLAMAELALLERARRARGEALR